MLQSQSRQQWGHGTKVKRAAAATAGYIKNKLNCCNSYKAASLTLFSKDEESEQAAMGAWD